MKHTLVLCILLAAGCSAFFPGKDVDFQPFLRLQQKAMRSLMKSQAASDDQNLINDCFTQYITHQQAVLGNYNRVYNGCVSRAQTDKNELTAQSAELRQDLLLRSDGMCNGLHSCDQLVDGLQFFDCYRNASIDSYKVMFTLNSDANGQFNTISAKYSVIESDLTQCVEEARLDYARELEKCDTEFNVCLYGGEVITEPTTQKPIDSTTEEPVVSTEEPVVSTEEPAVSTESPEPESTTEVPVVSTEEPVVSTESPEPEPTTEEPDVSTEEPADSTESPEPEPTTGEPVVSTEEPAQITTEEPERSPEEDLKMMPVQTFRGALDKLKRFF